MYRMLIKIDWLMTICVLLLLGVGLMVMYSLSLSISNGTDANLFFKQSIFAAIGILVMIFFIFFDYRYFSSYSTALYFATLIILTLVLFWGTSARGTVGWIGLGFFNIQPVEIAKLSLIIFLASFISKKKSELGGVVRLVASLILASAMIFLVIRQPDFGSAMILAVIWLGMMLVSGINKKHFFFLFIFILLIASISWVFLADYQKARITNFFNPELDPRGSGYNAIQSVVAVGSGGIVGKGLSHGSQSQLNFLPEKHTDFVFAVITEELGFVGAIFILALYLVLFFRIRKIAQNTSENFGYLVTSGIMIMLFAQVFINIGMNIKMVPVTGITLPLLSYGGSSMVMVFAALGIVLNINLRNSADYSSRRISA